MSPPCTAECWTPAPCPTCGRDMYPRGRSVPLPAYQPDCCEVVRYTRANPRHLWDEHDETRQIFDPEGWAAHVKTCGHCRDEEE